jgi:hypothetical protein
MAHDFADRVTREAAFVFRLALGRRRFSFDIGEISLRSGPYFQAERCMKLEGTASEQHENDRALPRLLNHPLHLFGESYHFDVPLALSPSSTTAIHGFNPTRINSTQHD